MELNSLFEILDHGKSPIINSCLEADLYKGTQITRWSTRNYIKSENDCEHQNIVTQIVIILLDIFNLKDDIRTQRDALGLASIHDMFEYTEGGMGDVPHHIKEKSQKIRQIVEDHEYETILSKPYFGNAYYEYTQNSLANKIVDLADTIDVVLYINREFTLGNKDEDFRDIYIKALNRVSEKYNILKEELDDKKI